MGSQFLPVRPTEIGGMIKIVQGVAAWHAL
jgi:hypothetical protein